MVTVKPKWNKTRDGVAAADSTLLLNNTNNNMDYRQAPSGRYVDLPKAGEALYLSMIADHASDPDAGQVIEKVWLYYEEGPAQLVCQITWTIGKQKVNRFPWNPQSVTTTAKYADTAALGTNYWSRAPVAFNAAGADQVAFVRVAVAGARRLLREITTLGADLTAYPIHLTHDTDD